MTRSGSRSASSELAGEPAEIISTERVEQMKLPEAFVKNMRA